MLAHTGARIQDLQPFIPDMDDLESVIIVETRVDCEPDFDSGIPAFGPDLSNHSFSQFILTRPRIHRVCLDGTPGCDYALVLVVR